jgi:hypothetical protein
MLNLILSDSIIERIVQITREMFDGDKSGFYCPSYGGSGFEGVCQNPEDRFKNLVIA